MCLSVCLEMWDNCVETGTQALRFAPAAAAAGLVDGGKRQLQLLSSRRGWLALMTTGWWSDAALPSAEPVVERDVTAVRGRDGGGAANAPQPPP